MAEEIEVGKVTHYFKNIGVAVVELSNEIKVGDKIHIKGAHTDFTQKVESMQIEHNNVEKVEAGKEIGLKVNDVVRDNDKVYKVIE